MGLPVPKPGLVVRYDYLWSDAAAAGCDQGKDRPACLVATSDDREHPRWVVLLPITHVAPAGHAVGVEIPQAIKRRIGLDDSPSWVVVSEYNVDEWPNSGLSPLPGRPGVFAYGFITPGLFEQIKSKFIELAESSRTQGVERVYTGMRSLP